MRRQFLGNCVSIPHAAPLFHLIARGPDQDAGMVAVAKDEAFHVLLPVPGEELAVVARLLAVSPGVECLVEHIEPQAVARLQQLPGAGIVGQAHRIEARLLQQAQLPVFAVPQGHRPKQAVVMMDAAALQLHRPAVDLQAMDRVRRDGADAENGLRLIADALQGPVPVQAHSKDAHVFQLYHYPIQVWMLCVPGKGPLHRHGNPCHRRASGLNQQDGIALYRSPHAMSLLSGFLLLAVRYQCGPHPHLMVFGEVVAQGRLHHDIGALCPIRSLLSSGLCTGSVVDPLRIGENPVRLHMQGLHMGQLHPAVDARARVPPGVGLHAGVHRHRHPIVPAEIQRVRDIHGERRIAVVMPLHQASVDGYGRIHHHPVEMEPDPLSLPLLRHMEILRISPHRPREVPHGRCRRSRFLHIAFDHVVMGKLHPPSVLHQAALSLGKIPVPVPILPLHQQIPPSLCFLAICDQCLFCYLYCAPVKFAVQPDCRPPAKYFPGDTTVNSGGLQYMIKNQKAADKDDILLYDG